MKLPYLPSVLLALCAASSASAQQLTQVFELEDVLLLPAVTHPNHAAQPMSGRFEWTYDAGDFENGTGTLLSIGLPWNAPGASSLIFTVDTGSFEVDLAGNFHNLGVSLQLRFSTDLSPILVTEIDSMGGSRFDIEVGGISHRGHAISGRVVPIASTQPFCFGDGNGTSCPCGNEGLPGQGCANSTGVGGLLSAAGTVSVGVNDLEFTASQLPPNALALLIVGTEPAAGGLGTVLGDGLLCIGGSIQRLRVRSADAVGSVTFGPGFTPLTPWGAGETRYFQTWHRDVSTSPCATGINLTHGVAVVFGP